ncbi:hypothetical protein ACS0TY_006246 [Phlomoides rotata]
MIHRLMRMSAADAQGPLHRRAPLAPAVPPHPTPRSADAATRSRADRYSTLMAVAFLSNPTLHLPFLSRRLLIRGNLNRSMSCCYSPPTCAADTPYEDTKAPDSLGESQIVQRSYPTQMWSLGSKNSLGKRSLKRKHETGQWLDIEASETQSSHKGMKTISCSWAFSVQTNLKLSWPHQFFQVTACLLGFFLLLPMLRQQMSFHFSIHSTTQGLGKKQERRKAVNQANGEKQMRD